MKLLRPLRGLCAAVLVLFLNAGCETDAVTPEQAAAMPRTVPVTIDSQTQNAKVTINGFDVGYTPADVNLEVDAAGVLAYTVDIVVDYSSTSTGRVGATLGKTTRSGHKNYAAGQIPARKLIFDGENAREDGQSTTLNKPGTRPSVTR
jgi:hypothetical protein